MVEVGRNQNLTFIIIRRYNVCNSRIRINYMLEANKGITIGDTNILMMCLVYGVKVKK